MRLLVTPAKAGVQSLPLAGTGDDRRDPGNPGIPAFAGMTVCCHPSVLCESSASFAVKLFLLREEFAHFGEELARAEGFGDIAVATGFPGLGLVSGEGVGSDRDDRYPGQLRDRADLAGRLVAVDHRELDVHQDQVGPVGLRHRHSLGAVHRLEEFIVKAGQQVADDLPIVLGVLDDQDALAHAASIISSTWTGSTTRNVEPWPNTESTEIVPPCISTMRFEIARPRPVPPFLRVLELSIC